MNITITSVGKIKEQYLKDAIDEYSKRLSKYCSLSFKELNEEKINEENLSLIEVAKLKEGERILSSLNNKDYVVLLDLKGKELSSIELAKIMQDKEDEGKNITFIIGGSYGVSEDVRKRANCMIAFSKLTFPHQLFRVILLEQVYRGFKINHNEKYHK